MTSMLIYGGIGAMGGLAHYVYQISKGKKFKFWLFISNIFLAGWLCASTGYMIPEGDNQYFIIGAIGYLVYPILDYIEEKGLNFVVNKLGMK